MNQNHKTSAMQELFNLLDNRSPIMPETRQWLFELEKLQTIEAYNLDPELMKIRFRNANDWYNKTYGK